MRIDRKIFSKFSLSVTTNTVIRHTNSIKELLGFYLILLVLGTISFAHFEDKSYFDSFWWTCVTAMTVGYGDIYPLTVAGKITGIIVMHTSVLLILPLLIGHICANCIQNRNEFTHEEQESLKAAMHRLEHRLNTLRETEDDG